jgi:recombination protein RecT
MVGGVLKLIRNSGELESIAARIVFENDKFEYQLGDDEKIVHTPLLKGMRGQPMGAYAIAKMKEGAIYREYMTADEIEAVKNASKAKDGPAWSGQFYLEMWKKSVLKRLAKGYKRTSRKQQ